MDEENAKPNVKMTGALIPLCSIGAEHYDLGNEAMYRDYRTSTVLRHGDVFQIKRSHVDIEVMCPPIGVSVNIHVQMPARLAAQHSAADEDETAEAIREKTLETRRLISLSHEDFALLGHTGHVLRLSCLVTLGSLDALCGSLISVTQSPPPAAAPPAAAPPLPAPAAAPPLPAPSAAPPLPPPLATVLWTELDVEEFVAKSKQENSTSGSWPSLRLTLPHIVRGVRLVRPSLLTASDRGSPDIRPNHAAYTYVADLKVHLGSVLEPMLDGMRVIARDGEPQVAQLFGSGMCMAETVFVRGASMDAEVSALQPFVNPASGLPAAAKTTHCLSAGLPTRCTGRDLSLAPGSTDGGRLAMGCIAANHIEFFQLAVQMAQPTGDTVDVDLVLWRPAAVTVIGGEPLWSIKLGAPVFERDQNGAIRRLN